MERGVAKMVVLLQKIGNYLVKV